MFSTDALIMLLSFLVTVLLLFLKSPETILYQIIALGIVLLLLVLNRFIFVRFKIIPTSLIRLVIIFLVSLLVQLLVTSTGGFFSPLLILLHLFVIGFGLFLGFRMALTFLSLSLLVLFYHLLINPVLYFRLTSDVSTLILYITSFIATAPLSKYLINNYRIKDTLSHLLNLTTMTEKSILGSLTEQVFITDQKLDILFASTAVQNYLKISENNILGKNLLDVLELKDEKKNPATREALLVADALHDKTIRVINSFYLYNLKDYGHLKMTIQINPITDAENRIKQVVVVLNPDYGENRHIDLAQAQLKNLSRAQQIKKILNSHNLSQYTALVELITKTGQDIIYSLELEDHPIKNLPTTQDLIQLCKTIVARNTAFSNLFSIQIYLYNQINDSQGNPHLILKVDRIWFDVLIQKLLDLSVLLCAVSKSTIILTIKQNELRETLIEISLKSSFLNDKDIDQLFVKYYGHLSQVANLKFGSGLEGYIAKTITSSLGIPFETEYKAGLSLLFFRLKLKNNI